MRRGQLLSLDAMLSLVMVIMILGTVTTTADNLRGEITSLLGWYERANVADNMLDVLVKNPGVPSDWEANPSGVKVVGLRSENYTYALSYEKLLALKNHFDDASVKESLLNLSMGKDFRMEFYLSSFNVSISGRFPRYYLHNLLLPGNDLGNVKISKAGPGNTEFSISYINLTRDGTSYVNGDVCSLTLGNSGNVSLKPGDHLVFVATEAINVTVQGGQTFEKTLPSNVKVEFEVIDSTSQYRMSVTGCPGNITSIHIGGQGQVQIRISARDNALPQLKSNFTGAQEFLENGESFHSFAMINGSIVNDGTLIDKSMGNSPWIEPAERVTTVSRFAYNLSGGPSKEEPIVYGVMRYNPPLGTSLRVKVSSASQGNLTLISVLGTEVRGLFVYGNSTELKATLAYYENGKVSLKYYEGSGSTITVPFEELFGSNAKDKPIGLWLYSLNGWGRDHVSLDVVPSIKYLMEPKLDEAIIKLLVWDDS